MPPAAWVQRGRGGEGGVTHGCGVPDTCRCRCEPDEYGVWHESGHHYTFPYWECLNEPDSEHHHTVQEARLAVGVPCRVAWAASARRDATSRRTAVAATRCRLVHGSRAWLVRLVWTCSLRCRAWRQQYTLEYDAMVAGIRRWADPDHRMKFVGLALANPYLYDW